jgi:hypothetical protein
MLAIGIDNSYTGAIAAVEFKEDGSRNVLSCFVMPTVSVGSNIYIDETEVFEVLLRMCSEHKGTVIGYEIGQKNPLFGTKGNFSNGYSYGVIKTVVRLLKVSHLEINPKTWQKKLFKDIKGANMSTKEASFEYCRRMYPNVKLLASDRCKKPHDGMADALCIASYVANP